MNPPRSWAENAVAFLEFTDLSARTPVSPPRATLFEHTRFGTNEKYDYWTPGHVQSTVVVESFLIKPEDFERSKAFGLHDFQSVGGAFQVDRDGHHLFAGTQTRDGIEIESIYFDHFWDGLDGKSLVIPSQHLVLYLGLEQDHNDHAFRTTWSDPLDAQEVMERTGEPNTMGDRRLAIDLDYLRDYLAARRKCLFILRWGQRFVTYRQSDAMPWSERGNQTTGNGYIEFEGPQDIGGMGHPSLRATLWEYFRVDPASKPRHYMLDNRPEAVGAVEFVGPDGNAIRYEDHRDFIRLISFKRDVLGLFNSPERPRWRASNISPGQLALSFPRGNGLWASDSPHGQIQVLLGDLAKLREEYQRALAPYSEMRRGGAHEEWFETGFMANPAKALAWHERLENAQVAAHRALAPLTQRNPVTPGTKPLEPGKLLRPSAKDEDEFFRIAKDLRRQILDEGRTNSWFLAPVQVTFTEEGGVGSIGALKGFMRVHEPGRLDEVRKPLEALNSFRQVDAHSVEAAKALAASGYGDIEDYSKRFDHMMESVCAALELVAEVAKEVAARHGLQHPPTQ